MTNWLLLIISLPSHSATARVRIWRALKALGCGALRDGAYLLPPGPERQEALADLARQTVREGGSASLLSVVPIAEEENSVYRASFDRSEAWTELCQLLDETRPQLAGMREPEIKRLLRKLRREFDAIRAIDYFPGSASGHAESAWLDFVTFAGAASSGEPRPRAGIIARLDRIDYQGRTWATRRRPWVDRIASAWLIRRFIDARASILWLESPEACPPDALGFDFDGAAFTHVGELVSFEVLAASFGLERDEALQRLAQLVHTLDIGGPFVPEASGFEAMLAGASARIDNDDELLDEMGAVLDSLYTWFQTQTTK